jgi:uncharacterized membrane protein
MLESKWDLLLIIFLFGGIANSIYLTYHHYRTNILHPLTKSFCVISETIDCDRVAIGVGSKLVGIPVATLGMFAHFFLLLYILSERFLELGIQNELYCSIYVILLMMVLFCAYEAFVSFVILKAVCIMCTVLYVTVGLMLVSCKRALAMSHAEIFGVLYNLFFPSLSWSILSKGLTAMITAVALSGIIAFAVDYGFRIHFRKKVAEQTMK